MTRDSHLPATFDRRTSRTPKLLAVALIALFLATGFSGCLGPWSSIPGLTTDSGDIIMGPPGPAGPPGSVSNGTVTLTKFAVGLRPIEAVDALPAPGNHSRVVFLKTDNKLYRDTGIAWTSRVAAADLEGQIVSTQIADGAVGPTKLASNIKFIEASQTLPTAGQNGRVALQLSDHKLYIDDGTAWRPVTGVAAGSSVTLPIQSADIADAAITLSKFATGLRPVETVSALPASGTAGRLAYRTTDKQLFLDDGSSWSSVNAAATGSFPVDTGEITDGAVTTVKLADGSVSLAKFSPGIRPVEILSALPAAATQGRVAFLTTDNKLYVGDGTAWKAAGSGSTLTVPIQSPDIADAAITTVKLADGSVVLAKLAAGAFTADPAGRAKFTTGFVDGVLLLDGAVSTAKLADGAVTALKLADGSVILAKLPDGVFTANSVGRGKFLPGFIDAGLLADQSVTLSKFGPGLRPIEVVAALLAPGTAGRVAFLTTDNKLYRDTGVAWVTETEGVVPDNSVTSAKIVDGAVSIVDLADGAVTTIKLADGSVLLSKIPDGTFTADAAGRAKFAPGLIDAGLLANGAVTSLQLADGAVLLAKLADGALTADAAGRAKVQVGFVDTARLADAAVTAAKLDPTIRFITALGTLPAAGVPGRVVFLTTDEKLHRDTGTAWTTAVAAVDILGELQTAQLADAAVTAAKIADGSILLARVADGAFTADAAGRAKFAAGFVDAALLADGSVTMSKLAPGLQAIQVLAALPAPGTQGRVVFLTTDDKLYRDTGTGWTARLAAADIQGLVQGTQLADLSIATQHLIDASVTPGKLDPQIGFIRTLAALPGTGTAGQVVYLTTDGKLYRYAGAAWTSAVAVEDLDGLIQTSQLADASVTTQKLADGSIAIAKIPASLFTADATGRAKFAASFVDSGLLADGSVVTAKLADGSVLLAKLPDGIFTANAAGRAKMAAGFVDNTLLAGNAVTSANVADGSLQLADLVDGIFTANAAGRAKFAAGLIDAGLLADNSVTTAKLVDGSVSAAKLATGLRAIEVVAVLPAFGAQGRIVFLTTDNKLYRDTGAAWVADPTGLTTGSVTSSHILDGTVATIDLAANAVDSSKILDGTIATADLAANAVDTSKILDGTVSTADLASNVITVAKLAAGLRVVENLAVLPAFGSQGRIVFLTTDNKLYRDTGVAWVADAVGLTANSVTSAHILDGTIATVDLAADAVDASKILDGAVGTVDLAANSLTTAKLAVGLRVVEVVAVLPAFGSQGRIVFLTTDNKLYRDTGAAWLADPAALTANSVTSAHLVDGTITAADVAFTLPTYTRFNLATATVAMSTSYAQMVSVGSFTKTKATSGITIYWNGNVASSANICSFQLRVDGLDQSTGSSMGRAGTVGNNIGATAVFTGLTAASHTVSIWARANIAASCIVNFGNWTEEIVVQELG